MNASIETPLLTFTQEVYYPAKDLKPTTRTDYDIQVRLFDHSLREKWAKEGLDPRPATLADLTDANLSHAMAWQRDRGGTKGTANKLYRTLKAIWKLAFDRDIVVRPTRVKRFREPKRTPRAWGLEEMELIVASAERAPGRIGDVQAGIWLSAWFAFIYATGARLTVSLMLPTFNFDPRRSEVLLPFEHQKQTADQWMRIHDSAVAAVLRLRSAERGLPRIFGDWKMGHNALNNRLRDVIVSAGLRENRKAVTRWDLSHKVRKTFGTQVTKKAGKETARRLLGHASEKTTESYIDPSHLDELSARDALPELSPSPRVLRIHRPEAG